MLNNHINKIAACCRNYIQQKKDHVQQKKDYDDMQESLEHVRSHIDNIDYSDIWSVDVNKLYDAMDIPNIIRKYIIEESVGCEHHMKPLLKTDFIEAIEAGIDNKKDENIDFNKLYKLHRKYPELDKFNISHYHNKYDINILCTDLTLFLNDQFGQLNKNNQFNQDFSRKFGARNTCNIVINTKKLDYDTKHQNIKEAFVEPSIYDADFPESDYPMEKLLDNTLPTKN
jgi:hypothetical protein